MTSFPYLFHLWNNSKGLINSISRPEIDLKANDISISLALWRKFKLHTVLRKQTKFHYLSLVNNIYLTKGPFSSLKDIFLNKERHIQEKSLHDFNLQTNSKVESKLDNSNLLSKSRKVEVLRNKTFPLAKDKRGNTSTHLYNDNIRINSHRLPKLTKTQTAPENKVKLQP
jgi:hypothetical protein